MNEDDSALSDAMHGPNEAMHGFWSGARDALSVVLSHLTGDPVLDRINIQYLYEEALRNVNTWR